MASEQYRAARVVEGDGTSIVADVNADNAFATFTIDDLDWNNAPIYNIVD